MTSSLPQLSGKVFITDAGLETDLIFQQGMDLPCFASFPLLETESGRKALQDYYQSFIDIARRDGTGVVLETPTWRANPDWGKQLGYSAKRLDQVNGQAVRFLQDLGVKNPEIQVVVSGNLGPRGDGYVVDETMTADESMAYHGPQIRSFVDAKADMVCGLTLGYAEEAIGMTLAAQDLGVPIAIAFTVETDGNLPSGQRLAEAINQLDEATKSAPAYYMINCAHPTHFADTLATSGPWGRIRGIRANASKMSHEELDNATELDRGNEADLANSYLSLRDQLRNLAVVGGCCGTDHHHVDAMSAAFRGS